MRAEQRTLADEEAFAVMCRTYDKRSATHSVEASLMKYALRYNYYD